MLAEPLIVLAAGASSRMGTPKGLLDFEGRPWLAAQLSSFAAAGGARAAVVLGRDAAAFESAMPALARDRFVPWETLEVATLVNEQPELGPFSSLRTALAFLRTAAFVLPVDVPCPDASVLRALSTAIGHAPAAVPVHAGKGGHPVLLSAAFSESLARLDPGAPDARLDVQLRNAAGVVRVPVDDARVAMDLDTPEAWDAFRDPA